MSNMINQNLFFVAAARLDDELHGTILASYSFNTETDLDGVRRVLEQPNLNMQPGKHYTFQISDVSWHLIKDENSVVYVLISSQYYPQRVAHACLVDFQEQFINKIGAQDASEGREKQFQKQAKSIMKELCIKYNNLAEVDKLSAVTQKIDAVKVVMQENVTQALANCVKLEAIEQATEDLQNAAGVFKKNATALKNKMWWKNMKMWAVIIGVVALILIIAISVGVTEANAAKSPVSSPVAAPVFSPTLLPTSQPVTRAPVTIAPSVKAVMLQTTSTTTLEWMEKMFSQMHT